MKQDFHWNNGGRIMKNDNNIQLAFLGGMKAGLEALIHGLEVVAENISIEKAPDDGKSCSKIHL